MNRYFLFFISVILLTACKKDDGSSNNREIDINTFPLELTLTGYLNVDTITYIVSENSEVTEIPTTGLAFNNEPYFGNKTYPFDIITFNSAYNASLINSQNTNSSTNQLQSNCEVTYTTDSISFLVPANDILLSEEYEVTMAAKDRSELKLSHYQTKLKKFIGSDTMQTILESNASNFNYEVIASLINDLSGNDTLSVQSYQLIFRP